jgi:SAM-dependent methyltransferase
MNPIGERFRQALRRIVGMEGSISPAVWRGSLDHGRAVTCCGGEHPSLTAKYRDELKYWKSVVHGESQKQFGAPYEVVFGAWQRARMEELRDFLALDDAQFAAWCAERTAGEIGAGPYPSVCIQSWRRAIAVDPLAEGYLLEGLLPRNAHCEEVVYLASAGESIPLPARDADILVAENCLGHVDYPDRTLREANRLLKDGGLLWVLVDLMDYRDHMHPNPFREDRLRSLLSSTGFTVVKDRVSDHKSHPNAFGEYRGLLRKQ